MNSAISKRVVKGIAPYANGIISITQHSNAALTPRLSQLLLTVCKGADGVHASPLFKVAAHTHLPGSALGSNVAFLPAAVAGDCSSFCTGNEGSYIVHCSRNAHSSYHLKRVVSEVECFFFYLYIEVFFARKGLKHMSMANDTSCSTLDPVFPAGAPSADLPAAEGIMLQIIPTLATAATWVLLEVARPATTQRFQRQGTVLAILCGGVLSFLTWRTLEVLSCISLLGDGWRVVGAIASGASSLLLVGVAARRPRICAGISLGLAAGSVFGSWALEGGLTDPNEEGFTVPLVAVEQLWCTITVCILSRLPSRARNKYKPHAVMPTVRGLPVVVDSLTRRTEDAPLETPKMPGWSWFSF